MSFPAFKQRNIKDCGPTCLRIILQYYNIFISSQAINDSFLTIKTGTSLKQLADAAEGYGFRTKGIHTNLQTLRTQHLPCIIHWNERHFVVVYKISANKIKVSDPGPGLLITYSKEEFLANWCHTAIGQPMGYALILEPTNDLRARRNLQNKWTFLWTNYIKPFKGVLYLTFIGLLIGIGLSFLTPFLTKAIFDIGISNRDFSFVKLIVVSQFLVILSSIVLSLIRSWIFFKVNARISISVVSKFLDKVMKLPISFYDTTLTGDIIQRLNDNNTIRFFISASTATTIFSFFNILVFGAILAYYNILIFLVFLLLSSLYVAWILAFNRRRKQYDYRYFEKNSAGQNIFLQIMSGIRDIRLFNQENSKRWTWEANQVDIYKITVKQTIIGQFQQVGSAVIDLIKNMAITCITAYFVIEGKLSIGTMLSIQYIIGQLNIPIMSFVTFSNSLQDALIGVERINEIYELKNEENDGVLKEIPLGQNIYINNLVFSYPGSGQQPVLKNVSVEIPHGELTAIVGGSGSGKTSIIKLLIKFYTPDSGQITYGSTNLNEFQNSAWRNICGAMLQDGTIFPDTIVNNIAFGAMIVDQKKVIRIAKLVELHDFVMSLPDGYESKIGTETNNVSLGQRQRLLLARIMYKEPDIIFLDEPTNSLDAITEQKVIMNVIEYFKGKTLIIVAHRLKTIEDAHRIYVLDKGNVAESGTHDELLRKNNVYAALINSSK